MNLFTRSSSTTAMSSFRTSLFSSLNNSRTQHTFSLLQIFIVMLMKSCVVSVIVHQISGIIADLRSAAFCLDPSEEEAGRVLQELIKRYGSAVDYTEEAAIAAIHTVFSILRISSQNALLTEERSLRKLIDKVGGNEPGKRKILMFFLSLLKKYGKVIAETQNDNAASERGSHFSIPNTYRLADDVELHAANRSNESDIFNFSRPEPPEEFICPLSLKLMYDPVVIASGQTYEKMWIQKWFDEGHSTCPKTHVELSNLSFTSNTTMKDLIIKWSAMHSVSVPDPKRQEGLLRSWESMNSVASLTNSLIGLNLPLDYSNVSIGSSHGSEYSNTMISNEVRSTHEIDWDYLSKFTTHPWEHQCNAVDDILKKLIHNEQYLVGVPLRKFVRLIFGFLKDSHDRHDMEAQMTGCQLLYEVVQKHGNSVSYLKEDEYGLLALLLDTEVSKQAFSILEELSNHQQCGQKIAASGALVGIFNILDSQNKELLEPALKILRRLSSNGDVGSFTTPSELMPKLIPHFEDDSLASHCIVILKNMCDSEEARVAVADTDGCIAAMAKVLEGDNREDQEYAVSVLLTLCSQRVEFCRLALDEGVIPGLVCISVNGNRRAAAMASEMLRILREDTSRENSGAGAASIDSTPQRTETLEQVLLV